MRSFPLPDLITSAPHPVRVIASSFNMLTVQQPWAAERLARHAGKTIRVGLAGFSITLTIDGQGRLEQSDVAVVPDVTLEIDPAKLSVSKLFDPADRQDIAEMVHISGQAALAQVVSDLARDLRPDPEDALAQWLGDLPARRIVKGVKGLFKTFSDSAHSMSRNTAEYLSEETDVLLGRPALNMFTDRQARAIQRMDSLEARFSLLEARLKRLDLRKGIKA